jgi:hypothetical protein
MNLTVNIHNRREERDSREKRDGLHDARNEMRDPRYGIRVAGYEISRIPHLELRVALFPLVSPVSHESDIEERRKIRWNEGE